MKRAIIICVATICALLLSGCQCQHEWGEASCTTAATCTKCGEVNGTPLEHSWTEASCTTAMTCTKCGEVNGTPMGHSWVDATFENPKTCSTCGETEGLPLPAIKVVEAAYQDALNFASRINVDQDCSYSLLHDEVVTLLAELNSGKYDEEAIRSIV